MATFGDIKISTINGGPLSGMRNAIINGNFAINQRGVSGTVTLSAGAYGHDRWKAGASGCTYTFATSDNVTTLTISAGSLIQVIEGANLLTDTYSLSWTGTAQGKIGAGSYGNSGITGSVTGGTNLNIEFDTGTVSLVQFERGSVATPFEFRSIGQELALCQRYYCRITAGPQTNSPFGVGFIDTATTAVVGTFFPVEMRTEPTALEQSGTAGDYRIRRTGTSINCTAVPTFFTSTKISASTTFTVGTSQTVGQACFGANSTSAAYLGWSAEL
jgi:hypothetical protein